MLILARCCKGHEYLYISSSAHHVSRASAKKIAAALNKINYKLAPGEVWYPLEIDDYSVAHDIAQEQAFYVYRGMVKERRRAW